MISNATSSILIQNSTSTLISKLEPQICQYGRLFYHQLFNLVMLVIFCSFFGWQLLHQR